jgi:fluoroquinolone resistance protein
MSQAMTEIQSHTEYDNEEFVDINLKDRRIDHAEFQNCSFTRCDLSQSVLVACRFDDCHFQACDLSLIKPQNSSFRNSTFLASKLIGINWVMSIAPFSVDFQDCIINLSSFFGMNLKKRKFINCIAHEVDFSESNMTKANCTTTDFAGSTFFKTNLTTADFSQARNYSIDFRTNTLTKAKFSLPEALSLLKSLDIILSES